MSRGQVVRSSMVSAGSVIAGRYRVIRPIASGGMGKVLEATDLESGDSIAIKLLHPDIGADPVNVERFIREGQVLAAVDHPNVVEIIGSGSLDDGTLFIAMELLPGETLAQYLKRHKRMSPEELAPVIRDVCEGLDYAHALGIVHRDLKPSNIVLLRHHRSDGPPDGAKLLDFGVSQLQGADRLTRTGEIMGTPRYMAPEQLAAARNANTRSDIYSLGVIIYEALSGETPFTADNAAVMIVNVLRGEVVPIRRHLPHLPAEIEHVIKRAMSVSPDARFPSAPGLTEAYDAAVSGGERVSRVRITTPTPLGQTAATRVEPTLPTAAPAERAMLPTAPTGFEEVPLTRPGRGSGSRPVVEMPVMTSQPPPAFAAPLPVQVSMPPAPAPRAHAPSPPAPAQPPAESRVWLIVAAIALVVVGGTLGALTAWLLAS